MLHSLAVAAENGFDIATAMTKDVVWVKYQNDPRVALAIETARELRQGSPSLVANAAPRLESGSVTRVGAQR